MNIATKTRRAFEAGGVKGLDPGHPRGGGSSWWLNKATFMRQLADVGDGSANSIVVASLQVLSNAFSEAPVQVVADTGDNLQEVVSDHPLPALIDRPNPFMTSDLLWQYYIWSTRIDGNAYFFKARNGLGAVVELWPLRPDLITPHEPLNDATELIDYYSYRPRGVEQKLAPEDVIHLRLGLDPNNYRLGLAPLKTVLKQILGDEEASKFSTALLSNMAVPGVVITPAGDGGPGKPQAEKIKETWAQRFGKDRNGEPLVLSEAMNVEVVSFSPQQMEFGLLHRIPEERVTGVLGVPAILAGMGAGLERATYSNASELREFLAEGVIIPDWARVGRQLTWNLLVDFKPLPNQRVTFNMTDVRALAEDQDKLWTRVDGAVRTGWLEVGAAKRTVGIEPGPNDEVYLRSMSVEEVPAKIGVRPSEVAVASNGGAEVDALVDV